MTGDSISRRGFLRGAGAAGVGALAVGTGSAGAAEPERHNVGTDSPAAERAARRAADSIHRVLDWGDGEKTISGRFPDEAIDNLRDRPDVRYVEADGTMRAIAQTLPWGIDRVDAEVAHANGETGGDDTDGEGGADIAIVDTGIDSDHPDLDVNVGTGKAFVECEPLDNRGGCMFGIKPNDNPCNTTWDDDNDHGSHVSGTANADDDSSDVVGVSTEATLHAAKVLDACGSGSYSDVAAGIEWVADRGYDVANMSLGGDKSSTVEDAVEYAHVKGVLLVAAAGNDGPCSDCVGYPAAEPEVIAVSATTKDDGLADFSSTGPEVELAAPGKDVLSTIPPESDSDGLATFSGTSMASPHVAGAGAQLMDNGSTNTEARDRLASTAEGVGLSSNEQGNGLVDAAAALGLDSDDNLFRVETRAASNVGTDSATLNGKVTGLAGVGSADVWFQYRKSGTTDWPSATSEKTLSSKGEFSIDESGLASDTTYEFRAVGDADGDGSPDDDQAIGDVLTFTTDSESGGGGNAPTVDSLSLSENNQGGSPHAEFDASWTVSDSDGDLDTVQLTLYQLDDNDGRVETEDSASVDVGGGSASGTTSLGAKHEENSGNEYEVELVVTDSNGHTGSATATEVEDGS